MRNKIQDKLFKCDINNNNTIKEIIQEDYGLSVGYEFYLVNKNGSVIESSTPGMKEIDEREIVDGFRDYKEYEKDTNIFKVRGCDKLKEGYYLYFTYLYYDENDTFMVASALIGAVICFFLLIWGRISYITTMRLSVAKMAEGNLSERIPYRYKNELRSLAEDINNMAKSLENEERKKNEFLTNISHDIRTPLTTIMGYLDMIKNSNYDSRDALQSYIAIMERKGNFLKSMLEDFFQYSKLESNDMAFNKTKLNLNELLRQIKEDEEEDFQLQSLTLELDLYKLPVYCTGDAELLARVISNLLSNAKKYSMPKSSVLIESNLERIQSINYAVFTVRNIPKEPIDQKEVYRLFDRLYKRDAARSEEGSGLGLAIVQSIIKLHEGKIHGSVTEEGLTFKIYIKS